MFRPVNVMRHKLMPPAIYCVKAKQLLTSTGIGKVIAVG